MIEISRVGEIAMDFGTRLKELLQERQLSQKDFAAATNIAASTVGNYIHGLREPDYETLRKMAAYFHVSIDFLLCAKIDKANNEGENELLQIYRELNSEWQSLLLDQAKLLLKRNTR